MKGGKIILSTTGTYDSFNPFILKGNSAAEGYWNLREKTKKTFEGEWTRTGDKYIRQKNGNYV